MTESIENYRERLRELCSKRIIAATKGYDILLEFSESQQNFHFNYLVNGKPSDEPSPYFMPIGYTDSKKYEAFRNFINKSEKEKTIDNIIKLYDIFYG